jgi:hypothetical protein
MKYIASKNKYLMRFPVIGFAVSRIFNPKVIVSTDSVLVKFPSIPRLIPVIQMGENK